MHLIMNKDLAVLQGAFLLADKLCLPSSLSSLSKADWRRVREPILQAVREICGADEPGRATALTWMQKIICVVWLKLMSKEAGESVERAWRENPFFSLQNVLPELNQVVLFELVKSTSSAHVFASFLLQLPHPRICVELESLSKHVRSDPAGEEDVSFFLEVYCWLWKGRQRLEAEKEGSILMLFGEEFARLFCNQTEPTHAAKKLKLETEYLPESATNTDVLHILFHFLKDVKDHMSSPDLCCWALSVSLNALYSSLLVNEDVVPPVKEKLDLLCKLLSDRGKNTTLNADVVREAQRDLCATLSVSLFKPTEMNLGEALNIITDLLQFWQNKDLLNLYHESNPGYCVFQLHQSLQRVLNSLEAEYSTEKKIFDGLMKSLDAPAEKCPPDVQAQVTAIIISHRLEDFEDLAELFVSETSWAQYKCWMGCLEKNQEVFRQSGTLLCLSATIRSLLAEASTNLQYKELMKISADIFSALSLEDKNKVLETTLKLSSRGFYGCSVPKAMMNGFEQELNMAFNCIIHGALGAEPRGSLSTAVSLVGRVAFQNPEAAVRSCCHFAVFNKGAFSLMASILMQLSGLRGEGGGGRLVCRCLREILRKKALSPAESEQLISFLGLLMGRQHVGEERGEPGECFVPPRSVINSVVLPTLSASGDLAPNAEFSLQLLLSALTAEESSPPLWVLECAPFPLLFVLAQLYDRTLSCWEQPSMANAHVSMDTKELLVLLLSTLGQMVHAAVELSASSWSRAMFWLYNKSEGLDWTLRLHLRSVWGQHFKSEVPSSLFDVCELPEQEWCGLELPRYGPGTGLLAWMECCCVSDSLQSALLSSLSLDQRSPDHINMFSKGVLVALTQILPWCTPSQWSRVLAALKQLIRSARLSVPFSLEYVEFLPLLDLRRFSCELRLSVLLLRVFQLLCSSSGSHWLQSGTWAHVCRLYAHAVREVINSLKAKLPATRSTSRQCEPALRSPHNSQMDKDLLEDPTETHIAEETEDTQGQEVLFVLSQLFCHVQHIQVMLPGGQAEPLFLCSLEILSHYEAIMAAFPQSCTHVESDNNRHFFTTITDNLNNEEMKAVLKQKIAQLVPPAS